MFNNSRQYNMKIFILLVLSMIIIIGTISSQNANKNWAIGLGTGASFNVNNVERNSMLNVHVSHYLNPSIDFLVGSNLTFNGDQWFGPKGPNGESFFGDGVDEVNNFFNLRYKFNNGYLFDINMPVHPFLIGGVGYNWNGSTSSFNIDGGVGFRFSINKRLSVLFTGTYIKKISGMDMTDDLWLVSGVMEIAIGKKDKDYDGDGVMDKYDDCPNTPAGVSVDSNGCRNDRDGDGILNKYDNCPDEAGLAKFNGCPDRDGGWNS